MKRFFIMLMMLFALSSASVAMDASDPVPIKIVIRGGCTSGNAPRSETEPPFTFFVDSSTSSLTGCFLYDMGYADVVVTSQTGSGIYPYVMDTSLGICQVVIPASSGTFNIEISLDNGDIYEGAFIL